jgi:hypothetical protein
LSLVSKIAAAGAALAVVGAAAVVPLSASAATPSCGSNCIDVFSKQFGTFHHPGFVLDVFRQGAKVGQPVILWRTSNSDPAEDFTVAMEGQVSDFYAANLVSSAFALRYGCTGTIAIPGGQIPCGPTSVDDYAFEAEYAPFGVDSGLCVGVASTAVSGEKVTLQPCGTSAKTVWAVDFSDSCVTNPLYSDELPLINASTANFSHPHVLTYPASGYPTDQPRPQLSVTNLSGFSQTGNGGCQGIGSIAGVDSNKLFAAVTGVLK